MSIPQDKILVNLETIGQACNASQVGTLEEQQELRQAITYIRNLYGRTVEQGDEIRDYAHRLGLPNDYGQQFRLPEEPLDLVVGNLQVVSRQCGNLDVLSPEWGDWCRQAAEYIGNLRQVISDWQKIIKQLYNNLNDGNH